jgi:DNA-binding CsgD family transcriptional regulator
MELIERAGFLTLLQKQFSAIAGGEGHCVFVSGEAGIGKTSLVKTFCRALRQDYNVYTGTCDALFTPRPLAPLYDILLQVNSDLWKNSGSMADRTGLFSSFFHELSHQQKSFIIVFEDIHWADEATLDFIKFLARRITQLRCLFILTYRDNEIYAHHPLRNILGQLSPDSFTRMQLLPLSVEAVKKMAVEKGYDGTVIYNISGGNPFYVNEILASYSPGVPDNIKDSILAVYNRQDEETKQVWQILSVLPTGFEIKYLLKMDQAHAEAAENSLASGILILKDDLIHFKHELYRRTVEASLSPLLRVALNKKIVDLFRESFEQHQQIERIIHHAKNANEYELVVQYAPVAAKQAASLGAHIEASRLYLSAIEYYQGNDKEVLIKLYEAYAYECYLINKMKEAIIYTGKSLNLWKEKNNIEKTGNSLRFLSRLWWFEGNRKNAEMYAGQAIETLDNQPSSGAKAMSYSNMSQLKMLSDEVDECIFWGGKAIDLAKELNNQEILSHALNNVGTVQMKNQSSAQKGIDLLQQSLAIALKNSYHEHAARAYTNLGSQGVAFKMYVFAKKSLEEGIQYCEERDLDSWTTYMLSCKARMELETGHWKEAYNIADSLLKNENQPSVIKISALAVLARIKMRKGEPGALPLLQEAKTRSFETMEFQRIIPSIIALLEYEWINGNDVIEKNDLDSTIGMIEKSDDIFDSNEFAFWLWMARKEDLPLGKMYEDFKINSVLAARKTAALWKDSGCPYEEAIALSEGSDEDKRNAISIVHDLDATAVYEKMKQGMRSAGIKSIPRGVRKSTQANTALLTSRELDVLQLLKESLQNKEIAAKLFISAKTVDHHISSILFKLEVNSRAKAVQEAIRLEIIK